MSYLNPLFVYGYDQLAQDSIDAGVDGFIVPDLPIEEGEELRETMKLAGLAMIQLVTPATPEDRIRKIAEKSSGFLYAVTMKGVTGESGGLPKEVTAYLKIVKSHTTIPVCAGFGVRSSNDCLLYTSPSPRDRG